MDWAPFPLARLEELILDDLDQCSPELQALYVRLRIPPAKWEQSPWGDSGGGFWAVAVHGDRVLWYNDIEEGFNVSRFQTRGVIPGNEYWCDQDDLACALARLTGDIGPRAGPPEPIGEPGEDS